jgi:hypothetical protein
VIPFVGIPHAVFPIVDADVKLDVVDALTFPAALFPPSRADGTRARLDVNDCLRRTVAPHATPLRAMENSSVRA